MPPMPPPHGYMPGPNGMPPVPMMPGMPMPMMMPGKLWVLGVAWLSPGDGPRVSVALRIGAFARIELPQGSGQ